MSRSQGCGLESVYCAGKQWEKCGQDHSSWDEGAEVCRMGWAAAGTGEDTGTS